MLDFSLNFILSRGVVLFFLYNSAAWCNCKIGLTLRLIFFFLIFERRQLRFLAYWALSADVCPPLITMVSPIGGFER